VSQDHRVLEEKMGWELRFIEWGNGWWSSPFLDQVIPWITHFGSYLAVLVFIIVSCAIIKRKKAVLHLLLLYGILAGIVYGLKYLTQRPRPFQILAMASQLSQTRGEVIDPSFPSAHSACAFMMATLLAFWFPRYQVIFYVLAAFIGWTRIYLFLHYPTDVIAGGILGYGITKLVLHFTSSSFHNTDKSNPHR
jgi:undecaprenyl-diphosphatase